MKWVEIISLRSLAKADTQLLDELLQQVVKSKTCRYPVESRMYQNPIVETDFGIHFFWQKIFWQRKTTASARESSRAIVFLSFERSGVAQSLRVG